MANKLQSIEQLEMLYKATIYTLREEGVAIPEKHEELSQDLPDYELMDLLDLCNEMREVILKHEKYTNINESQDEY